MLAGDTLRYSLRDAERWAAFSGDYNPIHFDAAGAQRLGLTGLCVHGMRAMLDVKSALSDSWEKHPLTPEGLMFTSRLREPVLCDAPYQLPVRETLRDDGVQLSASLRHAQTQQMSISSKLTATDALVLSPVTQGETLSAQERQQAQAALDDAAKVQDELVLAVVYPLEKLLAGVPVQK